ncbi:helix-turn-helix transcriptional regulator [Modestobacter versicolor]|uniref:helix-turn-helix transcriptional regulator n=1 Tax=Modestobacter versicolor TaxID=429133 RepID=UPI0034DE5C61
MPSATIGGVPRWDEGPLVGRAEELARLMAHVDRAVQGRPSAVLVAGDAGVGKTRLLDELSARAAERGVRVLSGHCVDLGDVGLSYLPFVDLLRPVVADPRLAPALADHPVLAGLLTGRPGTGAAAPADDADGGSPRARGTLRPPADDGRLQLFEAVASLLAELAADQPLLLVLEDLHWADRSSRDLLRYLLARLLARLVDEPILVVASYRADDLHRRHPLRPLLAELVRLPGVDRLELDPLPDPDVEALVRSLAASSGGVAARTVEDVVARAEGNAFYAEELLAAGLAGEALPLGLTDVLLARVEQLSPEAQQVLRVAAVAGRQVRHELVSAVSSQSPQDTEQALAAAVHHHLLVVSEDGRYRFRHALLREAVLADLLPGERVRLHGEVAAHLAANPGAGTAAERAHHARESNDLPGAFTASLEAADAARRVGAPAEQLQHLEAALALWSAVPDAAERAGREQWVLLLDTAAAARAVGELHRGVGLLRSAQQLLGPDGDPVARARVHYTIAQALTRIEETAEALAESTAAMALVPADPPSPVRTWAAATHARTLYALGRVAEGDVAAVEALVAADALDLDSAWADTAVSLARLQDSGDLPTLRTRLHEARERAERSGDADVEMRVWFSLAIVAYEAGEVAETLEHATAGLVRARALGVEWSFYGAEIRHIEVVARYVGGDWDGSLRAADELARVPDMAAHVRADGLLVLVGRGDPQARERLAWAQGLATRWDSHVLLMLATTSAEIELAAAAGDARTAADRARWADERLQQLWGEDRLATVRLVAVALSAVADAAAAARSAGDGAALAGWEAEGEALAEVGRTAARAHDPAIGASGPEAHAWEARLEAEAVRLRGTPAPEVWRTAVELFGYGHVYEQARSRFRLAEALLATDDRAGAGAELVAAHEVAVRLGAAPLRTAVEALARRGRLELPGVRAVDPGTVLTPREQEVLALMAAGRTNRQIGAELFISEKTASVHVSNILAKLGASGRTEAVALAAARGLLG